MVSRTSSFKLELYVAEFYKVSSQNSKLGEMHVCPIHERKKVTLFIIT